MAAQEGKPIPGTKFRFGQRVTAKEAFARQVKPGRHGLILTVHKKGIDRLVMWFEGYQEPVEIAAAAFDTFCKDGWV